MGIHVISTVLLRAPLLRVADLRRARAALLADALGPGAVALASRDLGDAMAGAGRDVAQREAALDRYGRRAAFRPTPTGWLAGVTTARLGPRTRIHTGMARGRVTPSWARLAGLGRALLDDADLRSQVRLRLCPSLVQGADEFCWLVLGDDQVTVASAAIDAPLVALIEVAGIGEGGVTWGALRGELARHIGDEDAVDDWLLLLIDQGLLCHDLTPPLVGPAPATFLSERLASLADEGGLENGLAQVRAALAEAIAAGAGGDVTKARERLAGLPGANWSGATAAREAADQLPDLHGVLQFESDGDATVDARTVERAAGLCPLLFRLQEALAPPVAERALDAPLLARLSDIAERFGAGAFDFAAIATGGHGARLIEGDEPPPAPRLGGDDVADLYGHLVAAIVAAAAQDAPEIVFDADTLDALLPPAALPPTFEVILTPAAGRAPWLLGHHAPAGASWGRFAPGLPALATALEELAETEAAVAGGRQIVDVEHAASKRLADLSAHPPLRAAVLALTGWPAGSSVAPADLAIVVDDAAIEPCDLRGPTGRPLLPSPLHRVRSTTLPAGLYRLLAGWTFARQHTPWSFSWGPLSGLEHLPRVVIDGFVIAPRSFRLPPREVLLAPARFARWRRDLRARGFDRHVQVGHGDELLPVDLNAGSAPVDLARHAGGRGFEIWPPLASLVDAGGRRIEIVAAVVTDADAAAATAVARTAAAARVPPPSLAPPPDEWLTFRLYGAQEQQDAVLFEVVAPIIAEARASDGFLRWFFLPYVDPGTGRDHLRVRLAARDGRTRSRLRRAMEIAVAQARRDGCLVAVETGDYFRETGRYGGPRALFAAEAIFEASSDAVLALLAAEHDGGVADDRLHQLVRAQDAIARGFALDLVGRRALADRRRVAFAHAAGGEDDDLRGDYRQRQRAILASLRGDEAAATVRAGRKRVATKSPPPVAAGSLADALTPAFAALTAATAHAVDDLPSADRAGLVGALPALLHVQAVRFCGAVSAAEQAALVLWARALESLAARARTVPKPP